MAVHTRVTRSSTPDDGGLFVIIGEDRATQIPSRIEFEVDDLPWIVRGVVETSWDEDGFIEDPDPSTAPPMPEGFPYGTMSPGAEVAQPQIVELWVRSRPGGRPVAADLVRGIKLGQVLREAIDSAAIHYVLAPSGSHYEIDASMHGDSSRRTSKAATAKRGRVPSEGDLHQAVDAYRSAVRDGRTDRLVAVAEACFVSTATAGRRLQRARNLGMLGVDE